MPYHLSEQEKQRRIEAYDMRLSLKDAADYCGCTVNTFNKWRYNYKRIPGIPEKSPRLDALCWTCQEAYGHRCFAVEPGGRDWVKKQIITPGQCKKSKIYKVLECERYVPDEKGLSEE
jgi:hypothetical protein